MLIDWDAKYCVGHPRIDSDHKCLIEIINILCRVMLTHESDEVLHDLLRLLLNQAQGHFDREEGYMRDADYPAYEDHHAKHVVLLEQVVDLAHRLEENREDTVPESTVKFLHEWLIDHIVSDDKPLGAYLAARRL
ncbi:MAG: hemerythrin family protein [Alphaproteobacteria bacterium]|nr:MAG: hemerythrin family protein [Alphaproteobacteria bacterium]